MVWSDILLVKAKFQEQIPRKPDLNNIKIIIVTYFMLQVKKVVIMQSYLVAFLFCNHFRLQYSYIEFCDSMVFLADEATKHMC